MSCLGYPVPDVLFYLSCPCCHVLAALLSLLYSVQADLSQLSSPDCPAMAVLSWLSCHGWLSGCTVRLTCQAILSGRLAQIDLSTLTCSACLAQAVLFHMSCPSCILIVVLPCLYCLVVLSQLSGPIKFCSFPRLLSLPSSDNFCSVSIFSPSSPVTAVLSEFYGIPWNFLFFGVASKSANSMPMPTEVQKYRSKKNSGGIRVKRNENIYL